MSYTLPLPSQFWDIADGAPIDENLQSIYHAIVASLREEYSSIPGFGTIESMLIERTAFIYVYIKSKEATSTFSHDRAYKETMALWTKLAQELRSSKDRPTTDEEVRQHILENVAGTIQGVLLKMHPDVADGLRSTFAEAFENASWAS